MARLLVTGNAGSGKTTFSKWLARAKQTPWYGLDSIVWKSGWVKAPPLEKEKKIAEIVSQQNWVIDGVSSAAVIAADQIYFLDIGFFRCFGNIILRFLKTGTATRETLPPNCPEYIGVFKALKVAILYQRQTRPWLIQLMSEQKKEVIVIRRYSQLKKLRDTRQPLAPTKNDERR